MQDLTTKSIFRWAAAFIFLDVFLGLYIFLNCFAEPDLCGVGSVFFVGIFYQFPFGIIIPDLGERNGIPLSTTVAPLLGFMVHLAVGIWFGIRRKKALATWTDALIVAIATNVLITLIPATIYTLIRAWFNA